MYKLNLLFFPFILLYQIKLILGVKSEEILKKRKLQNDDSFKILDSYINVSTSQIPKFSFTIDEKIENNVFIRGNLRNSNGDLIKINCGKSENNVSCIPIEEYSSLLPLKINEIYYFTDQKRKPIEISNEFMFYNPITSSKKYYSFDTTNDLLNLSLKYESKGPISFIFKNSENSSDDKNVTGEILEKNVILYLLDLNPSIHYILYYNDKISSDIHVYIRDKNYTVLGKIKMEQCNKTNPNFTFEIDILSNNLPTGNISGKLNSSINFSCNHSNVSLYCKTITETISKGKYIISFDNNESSVDSNNTENTINIILLDNSLNINPNYPTYELSSSENGTLSINLSNNDDISFIFKPKYSQISSYIISCSSFKDSICVINSTSNDTISLPYTDYDIYLNDETCGETSLNTVFTPSSKRVVKNINSSVNSFTTCNYNNSNLTITLEDNISINEYKGTLVNSGNESINFICEDVCTLESLPDKGGNYYLGVLLYNSSDVIIPPNILDQPIKIEVYPNNISHNYLYPYLTFPFQLNFSYQENIEINPLTLQFKETRFPDFAKDVNCNVSSNDPSKLICLISDYTILPQGRYNVYYNNCRNDDLINITQELNIIQSSPFPGQLILTYSDIDVCLDTSLPQNISFSVTNSDNAIKINNGFIFKTNPLKPLKLSSGNINNGILNMTIENQTLENGDYIFGNVYYTLNDTNAAAYLNDYQKIVFRFNNNYNPINKVATNRRQSVTYNESVILEYTKKIEDEKKITFFLNNNNDNKILTCEPIENNPNKCKIKIEDYLEKGTYNLKEKNACDIIEDLDVIVYVNTGMTFTIKNTLSVNCTNLRDFKFYLIANDRKENATNIVGKLTDINNTSFDFHCKDLRVTESGSDEIECNVEDLNETSNGTILLYINGINYISNDTLKGTSVTNSTGSPFKVNSDYNPYNRDSNKNKIFLIDFNSNITFDIYFTENATNDSQKTITLFNSNDNESHSLNCILNKNSNKCTGEVNDTFRYLFNSEYSLNVLTECNEEEKTDIKIKILQMQVNDANFGENELCLSTLDNFTIEIIQNGIRNKDSTKLKAILSNTNDNSTSEEQCSFKSDSEFTCTRSHVTKEGKYQLKTFQYNLLDADIVEGNIKNSFYYSRDNNPLNDTLTIQGINDSIEYG